MVAEMLWLSLLTVLCLFLFSSPTSSSSSSLPDNITITSSSVISTPAGDPVVISGSVTTTAPPQPSSTSPSEQESTTSPERTSPRPEACADRVKGHNFERRRKALIACLLPFDQSRLFSVQRIRPAIAVALDKVTSLGLLTHFSLQVNYRDSNCSISDGMKEAVNFYANNSADVYFGPTCDYAAAPVARQVRYWNKAMVTAGAMAGDFGLNKLDMFPLLTRVGANFNSLLVFLMALLEHFHWNRLKLLYDPHGYTDIMERYCHIAVDAVHHGLRVAREKGGTHVVHDHAKFYSTQQALEDLSLEVGNQYAVGLRPVDHKEPSQDEITSVDTKWSGWLPPTDGNDGK